MNKKQSDIETLEESTIYIYDEIGQWGISAKDFIMQLESIKSDVINIRINSPGGSVFEGITIANLIEYHDAEIIIHVDGLAASISSIIALSGSEVRMAKNAFFMVHDPISFVAGSAKMLRREADLLDKVTDQLVRSYSKKTKKKVDEILEWMADETWFNADEALSVGIADKIYEPKKTNAKINGFDLSAFKKVPIEIKSIEVEPEKKVEKTDPVDELINKVSIFYNKNTQEVTK